MIPLRICMLAAFLVAAAALGGCERQVMLRGTVVDLRDEELPGVAVTVRGGGEQDVTNGVGEYDLRAQPGVIELDLVKTGYTPGRIHLEVDAPTRVEVTPARLWPLPPTPGAYLFQNYQYYPATPSEPIEYQNAQGAPIYGTRKDPQLVVEAQQPFFMAYMLPPYDVGLARLEKQEVKQPIPNAPPEQAWVRVETVPLLPIAIDDPEQLLLELRQTVPLSPGAYAFHWGALDGYTETDRRIFMFRIPDPNAPPEEEAAEDETEEEDTEEAEEEDEADEEGADF